MPEFFNTQASRRHNMHAALCHHYDIMWLHDISSHITIWLSMDDILYVHNRTQTCNSVLWRHHLHHSYLITYKHTTYETIMLPGRLIPTITVGEKHFKSYDVTTVKY